MPKSVHRARRGRRTNVPAPQDTSDGRRLIDRILDSPHLAHVIPQLEPALLHRIIQSCGLEDCSDLVALATPEQLVRIFDLDLWRSGRSEERRVGKECTCRE